MELWVKHQPHILVFCHLVTKALLPISSCSQCIPVLNWEATITLLQQNPWNYVYLFARFPEIQLEISPMYSWQVEYIPIAFILANLVTVSKVHASNKSGPTEILQKVARKRGQEKRMKVCVFTVPTQTTQNTESCWVFCQSDFAVVQKSYYIKITCFIN